MTTDWIHVACPVCAAPKATPCVVATEYHTPERRPDGSFLEAKRRDVPVYVQRAPHILRGVAARAHVDELMAKLKEMQT